MTISIIALSGSLRKKSTNTRLLQEIYTLVDSSISFTLYEGIETLPQFNPDNETILTPQTKQWIDQVRCADALIVSSPEYAHGIPGAFKNALDWLVNTDAFIKKPFCLYRACPRPEFAPVALLEVLKTMSGLHIADSDVSIDLRRDYTAANAILNQATHKKLILNSIQHLYNSISH